MAGTLSRSKPIPGTGVVATTWNAGIRGAGEGAGAETRAGRAARAGVVARAARRTGGGRGAVTVTSGSVAATVRRPRPPTSRRRVVATRRSRRPATGGVSRSQAATPLDHIPQPHAWYRPANFPTDSQTFLRCGSHDVLPIHIGNIWQCGRGDTRCKSALGSAWSSGLAAGTGGAQATFVGSIM